jgi:stage II sporulation protein M
MRKKRGELDLRKEYKECWDYLKDSKKFIWIVIGIFFVFMMVGFFVPAPTWISEKIMEFIQEILDQTEGLSKFQLIKFIFFNNIKSSFFGMVLGILFGVFPILAAILNGYILGFVAVFSVANSGVSSLLLLLPHGIFEFPAIFISLGLGLRLGTFVFKKKEWKSLKTNLFKSLKVFLLIIIPLLIIAGIIEGCLIAMAS